VILAIDTTHECGSIAAVANGQVLKEVALDGEDGFGHVLFNAIRDLGYPVEQYDGFAAAAGPGTFTGIRIGLTAAKGLGEALGKPVYGVSNLEALLAWATTATAIPFYDARRGDVYARLVDGTEVVMPLERLRSLAPADVEWVTTDSVEGLAVTQAPRLIAGAIGRIAERRWLAGERPDAAALDANYVRRSDAELNWREA
jgi:tRNA threonylcarbamoyladenosine biosynthesis protein TsaB